MRIWSSVQIILAVAIRLLDALVSRADYLFILLHFVCLPILSFVLLRFSLLILPSFLINICRLCIGFNPISTPSKRILFIHFIHGWAFLWWHLELHLCVVRCDWLHRHLDGFLSIWFVFMYHFNHLQHSTSSLMPVDWLQELNNTTSYEQKKRKKKYASKRDVIFFFLCSTHFKIFMVMIFWIDKKSQN